MEQHFIYADGYPEPIQIGPFEAEQVRASLTGEKPIEHCSIITGAKRLLVRVDAISVLESRPKSA